MKFRKILAIIISIALVTSFSACSKGEDGNNTNSNTVTGGSVEDVFDLTQSSNDGEEVTIDLSMIDEDSGLVTTKKGTSTTKKSTTSKPNIKNETTLASSSVAGATLEEGYKLTWKAVAGAKAYNIYRADNANSEYKYIGTTSQTSYVDKTGSSKFSYKITVAPNETTTKVANNSAGFKGSSLQFANEEKGTTFISSNLNNAYIAFVRNEYAKKGVTCPPGRLAYVQISGQDYLYVFQFDNTKTWNGSTLEQVQIFVDKNDTSKYFSFFTKDTGSSEYLKAKETAVSKWNSTQGSDGTVYSEMQALLVTLAGDPHFQTVIDASY